MGLEQIREVVLKEAKRDAESMVETANKHAKALFNKKKQEIDEEFERLYRAKTDAIIEEFNRKLIQFKGAANKQILEKRNHLIDAIFEKARERILNLKEEEYGSLMASILEKIVQDTKGSIRVHKDDMEIFKKVLLKINEKRTEETSIVLDGTSLLSERGGFIFVADDYEVDQTLNLILKEIKKDMLPFIAKELFTTKV